MSWGGDAESEVPESWQEAAGAGSTFGGVCDKRGLVLEVGQKRPPLQTHTHGYDVIVVVLQDRTAQHSMAWHSTHTTVVM